MTEWRAANGAKDRERYLATQQRYNVSQKGRERNDRGNAKRIFVAEIYVGTESKYAKVGISREQILEHLMPLHFAFVEKQLEERERFFAREPINPSARSNVDHLERFRSAGDALLRDDSREADALLFGA
jgi:hypothetical protein